MSKISNIAKNTSYFTLALILQKIISFSYFIFIAKNLSPEQLGKYYFAISFTTIFAIFIDLGLSNVLIREVAKLKDKKQVQTYLGSVLFLKIPLALLSLVSVFVLINLMHYEDLTKTLVYLSSLCMVLDSFTLTFFAVARGFHNLGYESVSSILFQLIVFIGGFFAIKMQMSIKWLFLALVLASSFNFTYSFLLLKLKWKLKIRPKKNITLLKTIISITIPFAIFGVLQRLYTYLDSVLLSVLAGDKYVGLYQIAFKIIFALQFLPLAFTASLYPAFADYYKNNKSQLSITFERALTYLMVISLPISVGIISLSDKIIMFFNPEYFEAIWPLRIIILSLFFIFLTYPIGSLLNACDRQVINTKNMAIALFFSIVLNLILIPRFKSIGASITVLSANFLMFVLGLRIVPQILKYNYKKIFFTFLKTLFSAILMAIFIFLFKNKINFFLIIIPSALLYFVFLYFFQVIKKEDLISIWVSFKK